MSDQTFGLRPEPEHTPGPCGCRVAFEATGVLHKSPYRIIYCDLHAAAPAWLAVVRRILSYSAQDTSSPDLGPGHWHKKLGIWDSSGKPCEWCAMWTELAAIAQAKGEEVK